MTRMCAFGTRTISLQIPYDLCRFAISTGGFLLSIWSAQGIVKVRDHWLRKEGSDREVEVPQSELVKKLQQILSESGSQDALLTKPTPETLS